MTEYKIYIDAKLEGNWFKSLSDKLSDAELVKITSKNRPGYIDELTDYDVPDIILEKDSEPVLVLEKTAHVPTGKNPLQRVARMVKAAENGVTGVFFVPYALMKHGENKSRCNANLRLIKALQEVGEFHNTEMLIPPWPTDSDTELVKDGTENELISEFIDQFLENGCDPDVPAAKKIRKRTREESKRILEEHSKYNQPPPSVEIVDTADYIEGVSDKLNEGQEQSIDEDETVVSNMRLSPSSLPRTDPYTGAQFAYDYLYCRETDSSSMERNLVLRLPKIEKEEWLDKNSYNEDNKTSLWYKCADAIELKDALLTDFEKYKVQKKVDSF